MGCVLPAGQGQAPARRRRSRRARIVDRLHHVNKMCGSA